MEKLLRRARKNLILREEKSKASIQSFVAEKPKPKEPKRISSHDTGSTRSLKHQQRQRTESSLLYVVKLLKDGPPPSLDKGLGFAKMETNSTSSSLSLTESVDTPESMSPQYGSTGDLATGASSQDATPVASPKTERPEQKRPHTEIRNTFKRKNPKTIKNAVYCVIVLEEWLKELAAISQEHALWSFDDQEVDVT